MIDDSIFSDFEGIREGGYRFRKRKTYISPYFRPLWRIGMIICILKFASRGGKSSLPRLHIIDWATRSDDGKLRIRAAIESRAEIGLPPLRYDPTLVRSVMMAVEAGLLKREGGQIELTEKGEIFAQILLSNKDLYASERSFLDEIGKAFTEKAAKAMSRSQEDLL